MFFRKSKGLHISEFPGHKELSLHVEPSEFNKPEYVYIPLVEGGAPCDCLVKIGDKVKVGQSVAQKTGRFGLPLHSSISGEVMSVDKKMWHSSGKMVPMIEIKNDFLDTLDPSIKPNNVDELTSEDIANIARECGIVGLGGSGFPTFVKYQPQNPISTVIVNAVECEPYLTADYTLVKTRTDDLIRGIKYAMKATGAHEAYIAIKKNKLEAIQILTEHIAEENIKVFPVQDVYPAGWEKFFVQRIMNKTYKSLPSEVGAVVNNVATLVALTDAVENNMPLTTKLVTFTGEGLERPQNVYVKIGALTNDVIANIGGYKEGKDLQFVAGGLMTGGSLMFDSLVINRSLGSVIVHEIPKAAPSLACMGCGKCVVNCPVFLSPIEIKRALDAKNEEKLAELKADKCIACGLCSYICPSRIELTEATTKARAIVLKGRK